jgi:hypothetical protein
MYSHSASDQSMVIMVLWGVVLYAVGVIKIFFTLLYLSFSIYIFFEVAYLISFQMFLMIVNATAKKFKSHCGPCPSWVHSVQITILSC